MVIEVLVSTMNNPTLDLYDKMNIKSDALIVNQGSENFVIEESISGNNVRLMSYVELGLSKSRNRLISNATGDYCFIADDDMTYYDNHVQIAEEAIKKYPDTAAFIFNLDNMGSRYVIKEDFEVTELSYQRFGSVRILFNRKKIVDANIKFDERFGSGSFYSSGEDTIFMKDILNNNLDIIAVSNKIGKLEDDRESTWFEGFNEKYFFDKGALYRALYPKIHLAWIILFSIRKFKASESKSLIKVFKYMNDGSKSLKRGFYIDRDFKKKRVEEY